jgi:MFS family permease
MATDGAGLYRRNFTLGVINGAVWILSTAFVDVDTVMPAFALDVMGRNVIWVGLLSAVIASGWFWPPVLLSARFERTQNLRPWYQWAAAARIGAMFAMFVVIATFPEGHARLLYASVGLLFFLHTSAAGVSNIPFLSIVSDSVPPTWRGRFFGVRLFLGGLMSFAAGFYVRGVLSDHSGLGFPHNYARLFAISSVFVLVSLGAFCFVDEPPRAVQQRKLPLGTHLRRGPRLYMRDRNFRHVILLQALTALSFGLAVPFIVPFAVQDLNVAKSAIGLFLGVKLLSFSCSNLLWSYLSDARGNRLLLVAASALGIAVPAMVCLAPMVPQGELHAAGGLALSARGWFILATFAMVGASNAGLQVGVTNYLLEIIPPRLRSTCLGFYYTTALPLAFVPVLGAVLIGARGHYALGFALSGIAAIAALLLAFRLREIRHSDTARATP